MGPINSKTYPGRGDKNEAHENIINVLLKNERQNLIKKYALLAPEDQSTLTKLLKGEDIPALLKTDGMLEMFMTELSDEEKRALLKDAFAFMDAHPIDLSAEPSPSPTSPNTKRKIAFLQQPTQEMED